MGESDNVGESCDTEHGMKSTLKKMATSVALCTTKDSECKTQLAGLEKQLTSQIAARKKKDSWQQKHLANATALVNLHIRNDILGDVKSADANKHMKGDVCQMQMVEHVWTIHDFVVADNRICVTGHLAALKANAESCFDDPDRKNILEHVKNLQDHVKKNEEKYFDADLDAIIKDVLTMAIATHESDNVAPAATKKPGSGGKPGGSGLRILSDHACITFGAKGDTSICRVGPNEVKISGDIIINGRSIKKFMERFESFMKHASR